MAQRTRNKLRLNIANHMREQAKAFRNKGKFMTALILEYSAASLKTDRLRLSPTDKYLNDAKWFVDVAKDMADGDKFTVWHHVEKNPRKFTAIEFERVGETLQMIALGNITFAL